MAPADDFTRIVTWRGELERIIRAARRLSLRRLALHGDNAAAMDPCLPLHRVPASYRLSLRAGRRRA